MPATLPVRAATDSLALFVTEGSLLKYLLLFFTSRRPLYIELIVPIKQKPNLNYAKNTDIANFQINLT